MGAKRIKLMPGVRHRRSSPASRVSTYPALALGGQETRWYATVIASITFVVVVLAVLGMGASPAEALLRTEEESVILVEALPLLQMDVSPNEIVFDEDEILLAFEMRADDGPLLIPKEEEQQLVTAGNIPYSLWVSADAPFFQGAFGDIPVENLEWRISKRRDPDGNTLDDEREWVPLSTFMAKVWESPVNARRSFDLDFRLSLDLLEPAGTYTVQIVYSLIPAL